jgi:c-di-GMP-related signal transduction protein
VAAHKVFEYFGDKSGQDFDQPEIFSGNPQLVVFGQTYVTTKPAVNADNLSTIEKLAGQYSKKIDNLLTPVAGLGDLQNIIYTFVNQQSKAKALDKIDAESFFSWLQGSKVSPNKQAKIAEINKSNSGVLDGMFALVRELMKAKDEVIRELDAAEGDITAHTGGKPGGEGYMSTDDAVKLVPRDRWTPYRAD